MSEDWLRDILGTASFDELRDSPPTVSALQPRSGIAALREIERRRPGRKRWNHNQWLRKQAIDIGDLAPGVEYWVVENPVSQECAMLRQREKDGSLPEGFCERLSMLMEMEGALNGYVAFEKRHAPMTIRRRGAGDDVFPYVPVHGGITYINKDQTACVFGFDTAHYNSRYVPGKDKNWIRWQCQVLYEGLILAAKIGKHYLRTQSNERRAELVQPLLDLVPEEDLGFSAIINLLGGQL